jgi:hypothetical protein
MTTPYRPSPLARARNADMPSSGIQMENTLFWLDRSTPRNRENPAEISYVVAPSWRIGLGEFPPGGPLRARPEILCWRLREAKVRRKQREIGPKRRFRGRNEGRRVGSRPQMPGRPDAPRAHRGALWLQRGGLKAPRDGPRRDHAGGNAAVIEPSLHRTAFRVNGGQRFPRRCAVGNAVSSNRLMRNSAASSGTRGQGQLRYTG